jgi:hypothetical protein
MVQITSTLLDSWASYCVGRRDEYAIQHQDGRYLRAGSPLTYDVIIQHLQGMLTIGTYVIDEAGLCHFAVFDDDTPDGLMRLHSLHTSLAGRGIPSYLEQSRRGAHLWVFLAAPVSPALLRSWLLPFCPAGVEFYPKQDALTPDRPYGSLVRLPLGVHRLSGARYPFVELVNGVPLLLASSVLDMLTLFPSLQRVTVPETVALPASSVPPVAPTDIPFTCQMASSVPPTIRAWCLQYDPLEVIGRYVALDEKGMGCCPFGWHHDDGVDTHPSLWVYRPSSASSLCCWYCNTWGQGGSLFDFLRYYYGLEASDLWSRLCSGAQF